MLAGRLSSSLLPLSLNITSCIRFFFFIANKVVLNMNNNNNNNISNSSLNS